MPIPKPSDIPDLDTPLTSAELRTVLEALNPKIPWTPSDQKYGRKIGGFSERGFGSEGDGVAENKARYEWLATTYGWVISFRYEGMSRSYTVYANKPA